jgi:hypothetical protein
MEVDVRMRKASFPEASMVFEAMVVVATVAVTKPDEREVAEVKNSDDAVATVSEGITIGVAKARMMRLVK